MDGRQVLLDQCAWMRLETGDLQASCAGSLRAPDPQWKQFPFDAAYLESMWITFNSPLLKPFFHLIGCQLPPSYPCPCIRPHNSIRSPVLSLTGSLVDITTPVRGVTTPPPVPISTCQPQVARHVLLKSPLVCTYSNGIQYASVFFWPQESSQTACLASVTQAPVTFPLRLNPQ